MSKNSYAEHEFYCINCGNKGIGLMRRQSFKHKSMHRKKLYCIHCKTEVNHVECKNFEEVETFKENFAKGMYVDESKESISFVRNSCIGKELFGSC